MGALDITEQSSFAAIAEALVRNVEAAISKLRSMTIARRAVARAGGVVAQAGNRTPDRLPANNYQRLVHAQEGDSCSLSYAQDHWVAVPGYQELSSDEIVALWRGYNVIWRTSSSAFPWRAAGRCARTGRTRQMTLGFLADDYVRHLRHRLAQAGAFRIESV